MLLTESLILASLGGVAGIAIGYGIVQWFQSFQNVIFMTDLPFSIPFRMDTPRAPGKPRAVRVEARSFVGLAPALQGTRRGPGERTQVGGRGRFPDAKRLWGRNVLVVAQVFHVPDAADGVFPDGPGVFQHTLLENTGFRERTICLWPASIRA